MGIRRVKPAGVLAAACAIASGTASPRQAQAPTRGLQEGYIQKLEKNLRQNIMPFWLSKSLDRENGGYTIHFGPKSEPLGPGTKMIVTQARQVWLFSRLVRAGYCEKECLEAADLGFRFLREKMWDQRHGGFYWEVDAAGTKVLRPNKHLYGQSFALYAISEYYLATKRKEALQFAQRVFDLLESKAHDKLYSGYLEYFREDWSLPPAGENSYMGTPPGLKLMNTHLHLLEALTTFYRASQLPLARERLMELINIETNAVVRKTVGACTDQYTREWKPLLEGTQARVSYGHDLENVWLVIDACRAAGISEYPFLDLFRTLWDYSLRYGYDESNGGFFYTGPFGKPAEDRNKNWWVQAEVLVSALHMYRLTKEPRYLMVFQKTYDFIERHMTDWENGEWHETVTLDLKPRGNKAHSWKAGYHNGRAMIESIGLLREIR